MQSKTFKLIVVGCMALVLASCNTTHEGSGTQHHGPQIDEELMNGEQSTFSIALSTEGCDETSSFTSQFSIAEDSIKDLRIIQANSIPTHKTGRFPNQGNPNTIRPIEKTYRIDLTPEKSGRTTEAKGMSVGILLNGVEVDPFTNEFFVGSAGVNRGWNLTALTSSINLGTDCNNAHVQPSGKYHYHGTPNAYLDELGADGTSMILVGYAADGFPMYYKYGLNDDGELIEIESGYRIKVGERPGDGKSAPGGTYNGTYFQDYEYVKGVSLLDECNGRFGPTPNNPDGEYYYVVTDNFPSSPLCLMGTPSEDFMIRAGGPAIGGDDRPNRPNAGGPGGGHPDPRQIMQHLDTNHDGRISKSEAKGPLSNDFDRVDSNGDGFITPDELSAMGPPQGRRP